MKWRFVWATFLFLMITAMPMLALETVSAASDSRSLPVGSWWTVKGDYMLSLDGWGMDAGSYVEKGNFTMQFLVQNATSESNTITIRVHTGGPSTCVASGVWSFLCDQATFTWSNDRYYTIALSTYILTYYINRRGEVSRYGVGHPTWLLTDPTSLNDGGTTSLTWCLPTRDVKDCTATDVRASVSTTQTNLKGNTAGVFVVTYTGQALGKFYNNGGVYSLGTETDSLQYDPVYGLLVGASIKAMANMTEPGGKGGWTDSYVENDYFEDASLSFTAPVSLDVQPGAGVAVTVDGTNYSGSQLPTRFEWVIGTTHTLQVNPTIQGAAGVEYVFVEWSDGSKETSRALTVTQESSLTATFKTRYQLTVTSDLGNPQGSGWYDANTQAAFSVTTPLAVEGFMGTLGGKYVFDHWTGDSTVATPTASVTMDGPKTVKAEWQVDNTIPYTIIGVAILAIVIAIVAFFTLRRRPRTQKKASEMTSPIRGAPSVSTPGPQLAARSSKLCVTCVASLPAYVTLFSKCGSKQ